MRTRMLTTALFALALAVPALAQDYLPAELSGWKGGPAARVQSADFGLGGGELPAAAPLLREYGAQSLERRTYEQNGASLLVTVYHMKDPTAAYGLFTFLRSKGMEGGKLGEYSALSRDRALVAVGDLLLEVTGADLPRRVGDLNGFVAQLYPKARLGPLPTVGDYLPTKERIEGSRRYVAGPLSLAKLVPLAEGDWIGFRHGAEVELARYRASGAEATLVVANYPTRQVAAKELDRIQETLAASGNAGKNSMAVRSVSLIAIAVDAPSRAAAETLLRKIRYDAELTWNEPSYSATDPTIADVVLGSIYGAGTLFLLGFVAGVALGFVRVLAKRHWPGRFFDRPASVEIIQLGLTSKPIEAKDLY